MLVPRSPPRAAKKAARLRLPVPRPDTSYDSSCLLRPTEAALTGLLGWGAGRSRKPPRTLKLRPSPRIRGDAAEARLRVSEASCASRCLLSPTLAPPSAFGSRQVPFHLVQVPGTVPQEARRPPGPCPSPSQQSSSGPRLRTELYEGPDAAQIGTCWRKCPSHLIRSGDGGSTRPPSGLSGGTQF